MKFLKYKTLSQFIDTENLYNRLTLLSEVFMLGDDYIVFLKNTVTNEIYYIKETFPGAFEVITIPTNTWGVTVNEQTLVKCYFFSTIGLNYFTFKINSQQYLSILEDDAGQNVVYVDNTDDSRAMNFFNTACPIITTALGENQTLHSFNNLQDGSNSSVLYNTAITWSDQTSELTPLKIDDVLTTNQFTHLSFSYLINDTANSNMAFTYSIISDTLQLYVYDIQSFQSSIFNQVNGVLVNPVRTFNLSTLEDYISLDVSDNLLLTVCTNNTLIYLDKTTGTYLYKNILAHYTDESFYNTTVFQNQDLKYNLFKQILYTFEDVTDVRSIRISRLVLDSNMFMKAESNIGIVSEMVYKESGTYLDDAQSSLDVLALTDAISTSALIRQVYAIDSNY